MCHILKGNDTKNPFTKDVAELKYTGEATIMASASIILAKTD